MTCFVVAVFNPAFDPLHREFDEHLESEFLVTAIEALRCNAKRSGGFSLLTVLDVRFGHVPDDWRVFAGYHDKGRHGSHVKRVMTRFDSRCVNLFKEFKIGRSNASYRLKVNEFSDSVSRCTGRQAQQCVEWPEALESS